MVFTIKIRFSLSHMALLKNLSSSQRQLRGMMNKQISHSEMNFFHNVNLKGEGANFQVG